MYSISTNELFCTKSYKCMLSASDTGYFTNKRFLFFIYFEITKERQLFIRDGFTNVLTVLHLFMYV